MTTVPRRRDGTALVSGPRGRVVLASLVGTTIEFYDFYVYATAAVLVFPSIFFPSQSPAAAQLSSFVTFALAFAARPLGSIVFGHFGDRIGRKATLVASLLTMGVATFFIGLLPSFATIGLLAPILLAVMRCAQGIGLGGEWSGAALLATENAPPRRRALYGMFPQLGAPIGFIAANALLLVLSLALSPSAFSAWGWRIPFMVSGVLVILGLYVRLRLNETPAFQRTIKTDARVRMPLRKMVVGSWRSLLVGTFALIATYVIFYFMTTFTLTYGTTPASTAAGAAAAQAAGKPFDKSTFQLGLGFARPEFLMMLIVGVAFFGLLTPVSAWFADRWGRRLPLIGVTILIALFGLTFQPWLGHGAGHPVLTTAFLAVGLALMGLTWGPLGALLPELFPTNVRYTGSAVAYNVAGVLGASVAPIIAVLLWRPNGDITIVGLYLTGAAVLTLVALALMPETCDVDLVDEMTVDDAHLASEDDSTPATATESTSSPRTSQETSVLWGRVRTRTGSAVANARLTLLGQGDKQLATAVADDSGTFRFVDGIPGARRLVCQAPHHHPEVVSLCLGADTQELDVVLGSR